MNENYSPLPELVTMLEQAKGYDEAFSVYTHNEGVVILQFCGFSINLYEDHTWIAEDTSGG